MFLPTTCEHYANWGYYECSLDKELLFDSHQLVCVENGCVAQRIKCQIKSKNRDRESIRDDSAVTKTSLRHKFQRATRSASPQGHKSSRSRRQNRRREAASKSIHSRDDILLLRFAQKHNAWVLSNDKFRSVQFSSVLSPFHSLKSARTRERERERERGEERERPKTKRKKAKKTPFIYRSFSLSVCLSFSSPVLAYFTFTLFFIFFDFDFSSFF